MIYGVLVRNSTFTQRFLLKIRAVITARLSVKVVTVTGKISEVQNFAAMTAEIKLLSHSLNANIVCRRTTPHVNELQGFESNYCKLTQ